MNKSNGQGLGRVIRAAGSSCAGFKAALINEAAFRQELFLVICLVPVALWLGETGLEKAALLAALLVVLIVELLNSAIEAVVDRVGPEYHLLSGRAKDMGSAAVFLAFANLVVVWLLVLVL